MHNYEKVTSGWFEKSGKILFMRSVWELNYAHYLNFLIQHKIIKDWEYEVDTFWFEGIKRGVMSYTPDFKVIMPDDTVQYHEVKGWLDAKSATKLDRMRIYHPKVTMVVIREKQYLAISKQSKVIKGWGHWITEKPVREKPAKQVKSK